MMSGVLLAVALYAVIRWEAVVNAAVGTGFTDGLFIALGVLSIAIAAFSLVIQRNYKRMLAYSSIEHTGLICVGLALGPLGTFAAMLHLLNHTLAKSMMFFLAGRVLHRYGTTEIGRVSGLLKVMPWTGGLFAAGMLAVIGLPPFGLFISEFALFRAGFAAGRPWLMGLVLALLAVAFVSMIGHLNRMLYGAPTAGVAVGEGSALAAGPARRLRGRARRPRAHAAGAARGAADADRGDRRPMTRLAQLAQRRSPRRTPTRVADVRVVRGNELHCSVRPPRRPGAGRRSSAWGSAPSWSSWPPPTGGPTAASSRSTICSRPSGRTGSSTPPPPVPAEAPTIVSLATFHYPASRFEREIYDLFGIVAEGHPDPRPLVRHGFWPADYFPLRKDATPREFTDDGRAFPFTEVGGEGVYEIPVGPGARRA